MEYIVNKIYKSLTYILPVGDSRDCYLVDCGDVEKVIEQGWRVRGVLLTHAHFDHIYGLNKLVETFPDALVYTNEAGKEGLMSPKWNFSKYHTEVENFVFSKPENVKIIGIEGVFAIDMDLTVEVLFTPGHESSCLTYKIEEMLFTGDAYIPRVKTVTTFPRSNKEKAFLSLNRLKNLERNGLIIKCGHLIDNYNHDKN